MTITTAIQQDIHSLVHVTSMNGVFFAGDDNANRIEVTVTDHGRPVALSGTVYAYVTGADGETRKVAGTLNTSKGPLRSLSSWRTPGAPSLLRRLPAL